MMQAPSVPAPARGTVNVPPGVVSDLLRLIQLQIQSNCPGQVLELQIVPDLGNSGAIAVGGASELAGPLTMTNYSYKLTSQSPPRLYRASFPGAVSIGDIQVLASTPGQSLHIEVVL